MEALKVMGEPFLERRYHLLEAAAARLGARVRLERFRPEEESAPPRGGLARLRGQWVIFLNRRDSLEVRVEVLTEAVKRLAQLEPGRFLPPAVRELIGLDGPEGEAS